MKTEVSWQGLGFGEFLTIVFIILKLCGVINWSWWWVLSPIWIGLLIMVIISIGTGLYTFIIRRK